MDMRKSPIAIATLLLLLLGLPGGALETRAEHEILIAVVPAHWAAVINAVGHPFVKAFSPLPPDVPYHSYKPSPEDIRRALQADIIVVEHFGLDRVAMADDLRRAAYEAGKIYVSVTDSPLRPPIRDKIGATIIVLENVKEEVARVAREKGMPEAEVRKLVRKHEAVITALSIARAPHAMGVKGMKVAFLNAGDSKYMWMLADPETGTVVAEESGAELRPGDLVKLKEAGVRCVVILDKEKVGERVFSELRNLGINPIVGELALTFGTELVASCAGEPASPPEEGLTILAPGAGLPILALGALAAVATLALLLLFAFLLLRRR